MQKFFRILLNIGRMTATLKNVFHKEEITLNDILLSIIVPIYNLENYLEDCLTSLCSQTYNHFEVILVDDGSTDSSIQICENFCKKDSRFRLIQQDNAGVGRARNTGLAHINGQFYTFVDGDDFIASNYLESLVSALDDSVDIVAINLKNVPNNSQFSHQFIPKDSGKKTYTGKEAFKQFCLRKEFISGPVLTLLKSEKFSTILFPEDLMYEDISTVYKHYLRAEKVVKLDAVGYFYRDRPGSTMRSEFTERNLDILVVVENYLNEFKDSEYLPYVKYFLFTNIAYYYINHLKKGTKYSIILEKYLRDLSDGAYLGSLIIKIYKVFPRYFYQIMSVKRAVGNRVKSLRRNFKDK